jgi:sulfite exporter TauE/SafE
MADGGMSPPQLITLGAGILVAALGAVLTFAASGAFTGLAEVASVSASILLFSYGVYLVKASRHPQESGNFLRIRRKPG